MRLRGAVRGIVGAAGLLLAQAAAFGQASDVRLTDLTVPAARLPEGCVLPKVESPDERRVTSVPANATNPWTPTEDRGKAQLYRVIQGASRVPDGPPMTAGDLRRFEGKVIDDIEEAYMAVYAGPGEANIRVFALKYKSPQREFERTHRPYRVGASYTAGRVVAVIEAGARGPCFDAVDAHLRAIVKK
jgi:hypothetical protein